MILWLERSLNALMACISYGAIRKFIKCTIVLLLFSVHAPARATLIAVPSDQSFVDTVTGLEWLTMAPTRGNLATSQGVSIDAILGGYGGLLASGYRFATLAQLRTLLSDAGVPVIGSALNWHNATYSSADSTGAATLISLFGNVNETAGVLLAEGYAQVDTVDQTFYHPYIALDQSGGANNGLAAAGCENGGSGCLVTGGFNQTYSDGAFMVRDLPEPASILIFAAGTVWLGISRQRRRSGSNSIPAPPASDTSARS